MQDSSKNKNGQYTITNESHRNFISGNTGTSITKTLSLFQDPTYLGFKISFTGIDDPEHGGLLGGASNTNSARYYLKQIGDDARFYMLDTFVNLLKDINSQYPWYWQQLSGLDEAWKRSEINKTHFHKQIGIECMESLDLRITGLIDLYRKAAFDWTNRREVLTDNLRHFEMDITVYDNRQFIINPVGTSIENSTPGNTDKQNTINETFFGTTEQERSMFIFNLGHCEFNLESGSSMFANVSNRGSEAATQSLLIDYTVLEENNLYRIFSMLYNSDRAKYAYISDYVNKSLKVINSYGTGEFNLGSLGGGNIITSPAIAEKGGVFQEAFNRAKTGVGDYIENITDDFLGDLQKDVTSELLNVVTTRLNALYLGNVYGFSPRTIQDTIAGDASGIVTRNTLGNALDAAGL